MVIVEVTNVQQVTARSKGKSVEWETQEAMRKQAIEWIQKANERNATEVQEQIKPPEEPLGTTGNDPTWQALQQCQIMLSLGRLLQLVT